MYKYFYYIPEDVIPASSSSPAAKRRGDLIRVIPTKVTQVMPSREAAWASPRNRRRSRLYVIPTKAVIPTKVGISIVIPTKVTHVTPRPKAVGVSPGRSPRRFSAGDDEKAGISRVIILALLLATLGCSAKTEPEKFPKVLHSIPMTGITEGTGGATGTAMIVIPSHFASADVTIPTATAEDPIETALCIQSGENEECSAPFTVNSGNSTRLLLDFTLGMAEKIRTTGLVSLYVVDFVTRFVIMSASINQGTPSDRIPAEFSEPEEPEAQPTQ